MTTINSSHECHASNSGDNEQRKFSDSSDCESRDSFDAMAVENADAAVEALRVGDHRRILSAKTELDFLLASIGGESGRVPRRSPADISTRMSTPAQWRALSDAPTMVHILKSRARTTPDKVAYIFLEDGESHELPITFGALDRCARRVAERLQRGNPQASDSRVLLIYPQGLEFLIAFFGSLYAGAAAVLVYPPTSVKMARRLNGIAADCDVSAVLTTRSLLDKTMAIATGIGADTRDVGEHKLAGLPWICTDGLEPGLEAGFVEPDLQPGHVAFLQYTSGSTGTPKGVTVTHANLMANQRSIQAIYGSSEASSVVGWLPLIHDMGLIGNVLHPLFLGVPLVFMSPLHFMQRPVRWLRAISKYRATLSGGPNFAYDLCVNKIESKDTADLDLSCWAVAFNGAEPVRSATIERFQKAFGCRGLSAAAHKAVYGLAEATLIVTGTRSGTLLGADGSSGYVSSGTPESCDVVKVVDVETFLEVAEGSEGEVWVSGPSVAAGYWNRPVETLATFKATLRDSGVPFLRTGDTGFLRGGAIHITGRIKDVVIVRGRNYHAEDIEWSLSVIEDIRAGCVAAFSIEESGREQLVVVAGTTTSDASVLASLLSQVRTVVYADHQLQVDRVVFIKPKELPMTTSGKVQRARSKAMLLQGEFSPRLDHAMTGPGGRDDAASNDPTQAAAPSTDAERALAATWSEVLHVPAESIGIHDNFFGLGGSSLTMLELASRLDVSMELLFRYPTISGYLYRTSEYAFPDVASDIHLPPMRIDESLQGRTGISLITGATGFFGLHFLQAMMRRTEDHFALLVRGSSQDSIERKFSDAVAYFNMQADIDQRRITLIQGDVSKTRVGMAVNHYDWAARHVDRIFHIGSHVNNWLPYEGLRETNVDGTRNLLQLARTQRKKEFHYTSTSTFSPRKADKTVFNEGDSIDPTEINRYFGYDISKYASEELCGLARRDGIDCSIYRLVWVGGHLDTGLTKINDGLNIMLRILLTLGVFPQGNYLHDVVPVDLMAESMASLQGKRANANFNVTSQSKESIDMKRIVTMLRGMGYRIDEVSRAEFVERLRSHPVENWDEHCRSYRQLIIRLFEDPTPKTESFYDSSNFRACMDPEVLARMDQKFVDAWFEKTVNFLVRSGSLPAADGRPFREHMAQIDEWNNTAADYPRHLCLHQLFERQVDASPDAVAIRFDGEPTSYLELNRQADVVARGLLATGVAPRQLIGLSVHRSPALISTILGIFKAGCAYVPLDPTYPVAALDFMIEDCGATRILVDEASKPRLAHHADKLLVVDSPGFPALGDQAGLASPAAALVEPTDLAYVIYTSGTTGTPKGVMVEHRSVVNHNFSLMKAFGLTAADSLLQFSTVNFDSFIEEVFPTLFAGATLVMVRKEQLVDPTELQAAIGRNAVSVLKLSTAFWHTISDIGVEALGVRLVGIGGEAADVHKYRAWRAVNPTIPLVNTYGPTETTVTATLAVLQGDLERITIGKPIANTQVHVLDTQLNPVPLGCIGELYIGGAGVARGYLNRPETTARVFLQSPFGIGQTIYKSGDMVRWTAAGELEFLGRTDHQVKVRGYRVELGAIESVLAAHPSVAGAAVVVREVDTRKKIVAYFSSDDVQLGSSDLRHCLEEQLPSYMIPNLIVRLPAIPLNPNGKVDRRQLEEKELCAVGHHDFATPTTPSEIRMAGIWEALLNVTGIGLNDDFIDLGGHSLLVMSLVSEVNRQFGASISVHAIHEHPTVARLLAAVEDATRGSPDSNLIRFPDHRGKRADTSKLTPLFLVHGLGGHLASFYPLVKNLKKALFEKHKLDITVYGLEANGFRDGQSHFASLNDMASEYVKLIRQTQATGPYLLGGWSYGVLVAYQIAQELIRDGEIVEMFVSIDAEAPQVPKDFDAFLRSNNILELDDLYEDKTLRQLLGKFGHRFGFAGSETECPKQQFHRFLGYSATDPEAQRERYSKVAIANLFNARGFQPERINLRNTVLVRASNSRFDGYMTDWSELVDSKVLTSITLNGDHWSIMQDPELATQLAKCVATTAAVEMA